MLQALLTRYIFGDKARNLFQCAEASNVLLLQHMFSTMAHSTMKSGDLRAMSWARSSKAVEVTCRSVALQAAAAGSPSPVDRLLQLV